MQPAISQVGGQSRCTLDGTAHLSDSASKEAPKYSPYSLFHHTDHTLPGDLCAIEMDGERWIEVFDETQPTLPILHEIQSIPDSLVNCKFAVSAVLSVIKFLMVPPGQRQDPRMAILQPYIEQAWAMGYSYLVLVN